jgi:hypothetical protein
LKTNKAPMLLDESGRLNFTFEIGLAKKRLAAQRARSAVRPSFSRVLE